MIAWSLPKPFADTGELLGAGGFGTLQWVMLVLAIVGLTTVMVSTRRRIRASQRASLPDAREQYARMSEPGEATRDLEQVMLELDQLSRQIHGRIDTKLARLEVVIRDADRRIEELSALLRTPRDGPAIDGSAIDRPVIDVVVGQDDPREPHPPPPDHDARHADVYHLADDGLPVLDIARRLGRTAGEVELILALRKTKTETGYPAGKVHP